ncbi:hypothetical protein EVAR_52520_1 [Eumeta japonica]|uniref:Uncharacterized protein n=1 Tax=Eumeta variegata TaxID=151549 RepID=A0A4C1ZNJ4_EUMVA|nr:hypothetical protein EVAR_52520_1 [Eumeta japonica]
MRGYGGGSSRPAGRPAGRRQEISMMKKFSISLNSVLTRIDQRVTAASGSILTVGQSGGAPRAAAAGAGAGAGGAVFLRHGSERDDGDGDGDVE